MSKQMPMTGQLDETGKPMRIKEKIKADIFEFQAGASQNGKARSALENALLDLTRSALNGSLDDFVGELPPEKKDWLEKVKNALNKEISQSEDKTTSPDVKLNLIRIEIAREIDKARETENVKPAQQATEGAEIKNAGKTKKRKKYRPLNLNQVLLRRTLV